MSFNVNYEISSMVFGTLLIIIYYFRKRIQSNEETVLSIILWTSLLNNILDTTTVVAQYLKWAIPLQMVLNTFFYISQIFLVSLLILYILAITSKLNKRHVITSVLLMLPSICFIFLIFANIFNGCLFYFDNGVYTYGHLHFLVYLTLIFDLVVVALYAALNHKEINVRYHIFFVIITVIMLIASIIQYFNTKYLLVMPAAILCLYIYCFCVHNPEEYTNKVADCYNYYALKKTIEDIYKNEKHYSTIIVSLENYNAIKILFGSNEVNLILLEIKKYLEKRYHTSQIFLINTNTFIIGQKKFVKNSNLNELSLEFPKYINIDDYSISTSIVIYGLNCTECPSEENFLAIIDHIARNKIENNQYKLINKNTIKLINRKIAVDNAIIEAINDNSFEVYYQPIVETKTKKIVSLEALARLSNKSLGYIPPDEFIEVAEKNGAILKLGIMIYEKVCDFLYNNNLQKYGILDVGINFSIAQCLQSNALDELSSINKKYNINPKNIKLEITETYKASSTISVKDNLIKLKELGYTLALDDYGSGYSGLGYVINFPFDYVKIDKSLIDNSLKNKNNYILLEATIKAFKDVKLKIICEGIENVDQYEKLKELEVEYIQGFFFYKPLSEKNLISILKEQKNLS